MNLMEISFIIPSRGRECLYTLLHLLQKHLPTPHPPILVLLDGVRNTESTSLKNTFPDVRFFGILKPFGPSFARNYAAARANTPWLYFLDDDVLPQPEFFATLKSLKPAENEVVIEGLTRVGSAFGVKHRLASETDFAGGFGAGNLLVRSEPFYRCGGFDMRYFRRQDRLHFREDTDLGLRLLQEGSSRLENGLLCLHPPDSQPDFWQMCRFAKRYYFEPYFLRQHPTARKWIGGAFTRGTLGTRQTRGFVSTLICLSLPGVLLQPAWGLWILLLYGLLASLLLRRRSIHRKELFSLIVQIFVYPFVHAAWFWKGWYEIRGCRPLLYGFQPWESSTSCISYASLHPQWEGWKTMSSNCVKDSLSTACCPPSSL